MCPPELASGILWSPTSAGAVDSKPCPPPLAGRERRREEGEEGKERGEGGRGREGKQGGRGKRKGEGNQMEGVEEEGRYR